MEERGRGTGDGRRGMEEGGAKGTWAGGKERKRSPPLCSDMCLLFHRPDHWAGAQEMPVHLFQVKSVLSIHVQKLSRTGKFRWASQEARRSIFSRISSHRVERSKECAHRFGLDRSTPPTQAVPR